MIPICFILQLLVHPECFWILLIWSLTSLGMVQIGGLPKPQMAQKFLKWFRSPILTQYLRQGCVMINTLLSFCPHFALMLLFYNNKYGLRKYNILPVQHLKDCWCNSHLPKPTRDRQRQFPGWSLRAKTAGGASFRRCDDGLIAGYQGSLWIESGEISSYRWCNHCEQKCRNMFEDSLGLNGMQIYRLVRSCSIASV